MEAAGEEKEESAEEEAPASDAPELPLAE